MAKSKKMLEARTLRREGKSIKEIAKSLTVSVGSVSSWCRNVVLTNFQIENLARRSTDPFFGKKQEYILKRKRETDNKIRNLREQGIEEIGKLTTREIFLIGVALYWGEGFKKDHQVGLANSDIKVAKFFMYWLLRCFSLTSSQLIFRVTVNASYKERIREIEEYWAQELNVSISDFSKPFFQNTTWKKEYENKEDYHGVVRIKVRKSMDFLRKIHGYIEGLARHTTNV